MLSLGTLVMTELVLSRALHREGDEPGVQGPSGVVGPAGVRMD